MGSARHLVVLTLNAGQFNFSLVTVCDLATVAIWDAVQCGFNLENYYVPKMPIFSYFLRLPDNIISQLLLFINERDCSEGPSCFVVPFCLLS